jgi:hypothetical protein
MADNSFTIRIIEPSYYEKWNNFVSKCPTGNIFIKTFWLESIVAEIGGKYELVGCFKGDELVGGCLLYLPNPRWRIVSLPPYTTYNGIAYMPSSSKYKYKCEKWVLDITTSLRDFFEQHYDYVILINSPEVTDIRAFEWTGWEVVVRYTYLLRFDTLNNPTEYIAPDIKRCAKLAVQNGVEVVQTCGIDKLVELVEKTCERQDVSYPFLHSLFPSLCYSLIEKNIGRIYLAQTQEGEAIAGCLIVFDEAKSYYVVAGADYRYFDKHGNQLLATTVIKDVASQRSCFDLCGAFIRTVSFNKSQWGGGLVPHYMVRKPCSAKAKLAYIPRKIKSIYKVIW